MRPRFDVWFWLVLGWALVVPYLFDQSHARHCAERGTVTFYAVSSLWNDSGIQRFRCQPFIEDPR